MWWVPLIYLLIGVVITLRSRERTLFGILFWPAQLTPPPESADLRVARLAVELASPSHDSTLLRARIEALDAAGEHAAAEAVRCHLAEVERAEARLDDLRTKISRHHDLKEAKDLSDLLDADEVR